MILQFDKVTLPATDRCDQAVHGVDFALLPGDCLLVDISESSACPPLADVAQGLTAPDSGTVRIKGGEWGSLSPEAAAEQRHRIGRVFVEHAWISNLDVDENITLTQRHHTRRSADEIRNEALSWAARFGRNSLPTGRPAWTPRRELTIAQWVRALLGNPELLILERPTRDTSRAERDQLIDALADKRKAGAAVICLTHDTGIMDNQVLENSRRARLTRDSWEMLK